MSGRPRRPHCCFEEEGGATGQGKQVPLGAGKGREETVPGDPRRTHSAHPLFLLRSWCAALHKFQVLNSDSQFLSQTPLTLT